MNLSFRPVTVQNRGDLEDIDAGDPQRYWVYSPWYWHQWSLDNPNVVFRLVHAEGIEAAIGMVAYGPLYQDEALTQAVPGAYELIHLVIDHRVQRQGIGVRVARAVIAAIRALPDCRAVFIAHHPENLASKDFFAKLGFVESDQTNYDGDPMRVLSNEG